MISRCRAVSPAMWLAALSSPSKQLVGQLVPFTKQSLFSGESFLQQDFVSSTP